MRKEGAVGVMLSKSRQCGIILPGGQDAGLAFRKRECSCQRCGPGFSHKRGLVRVMLACHGESGGWSYLGFKMLIRPLMGWKPYARYVGQNMRMKGGQKVEIVLSKHK